MWHAIVSEVAVLVGSTLLSSSSGNAAVLYSAALNLRARKAKAARRPQLSRDMKPGIIIENVAQTRRRLAETTLLATASLAPGSSSIIDEGPTNTGSGSQDDEEEGGSPGSDDCHIIHNDKSTDFILSTVVEETAMVATLATPSNLTADPNGNLGSRPQDIDLVTRVLNPNQTVSSISDKIGDKALDVQDYSKKIFVPMTLWIYFRIINSPNPGLKNFVQFRMYWQSCKVKTLIVFFSSFRPTKTYYGPPPQII
ncbi:hypothetical protein QTP88_014819 [Uroleucon formosanum]